jgi:hypothetical protein
MTNEGEHDAHRNPNSSEAYRVKAVQVDVQHHLDLRFGHCGAKIK